MTKKKSKRPVGRHDRMKKVGKWLLIVGLVGTLVMAGAFVFLYQTTDIPDPNEDFQTQTSFVYFADGKTELGRFATQNRESIPLDEMPETVKDAVVAAENQTFWTDSGIDPKGIVRAAFNNAQGNATQGASTITQQYVKILYLTQEQTLQRKVKEAFLSLKIQREQSKEQILEGYLNTIYFGRGAYGVQAASKAYFDVDAKDLSLRESAFLATVLNNPTRYDPANGKEAKQDAKERYAYVLSQMAETGAVTAGEADKAIKKLPDFPEIEEQSQYGGQRGHVLTMVRKELLRLGFDEQEIDGGGLRVTTTFTKKAMNAAEEGVEAQKPDGFKGELHVATASVEPGTGAVRGFYGGHDYLDSQINWAVAGGMAGSTLKPFAVAAGIKDGFSLKDTFDGNSPLVLPDGTDFENQGDSSYGSVSLLEATEDSINTAFIDLTNSMENGPEKIIETATDMGIPGPKGGEKSAGFPSSSAGLEPNIAVALGQGTVSPINMANGYATLANEGVAAKPFIIERVVDQNGEEQYQHKVSNEKALDPDIAADVSYALQQVVKSGSGTAALELGRPAAGKTGTATVANDDVSSAWFSGYTPQLATSVIYLRGKGIGKLDGWLPEYFGGSYPARTWTDVMRRALEGEPVEEFPPPAFVDPEAPEEGHAPYTPPPPPPTTKKPSPTPEPTTEEPTETPSEPTESPTDDPTDEPTDCPVLDPDCETDEPDGGNGGGNGGGGGGGDGGPNARQEAIRERHG